uniref:Uncharacterized protein n=1 Tax=Melanopsichium pennsylvanicum 4 TaxID=1398559 RepID=A0A077R375_9BASI|nr:conserved hypothetical protein [Melanopsichium pennsylvanicum 4]
MPSAQQLQLEFAQRDISFQYAQLTQPQNTPKGAFEERSLENLREGQVANAEVYRMFRTHRSLFNKLALQSVALSTAPSSLYDVSGGSGFPNPSVGLNKANPAKVAIGKEAPSRPVGMDEANGILFRKLDDEEMANLRRDIFGEEQEAQSPESPKPL